MKGPITIEQDIVGYNINVELAAGVKTYELDSEDLEDLENILGDHYTDIADEVDSLVEFHSTVAISCLDDFIIICEPIYQEEIQ